MDYRSCMKSFGYQKWQKETNLGKFPRVYRYRYRAVPVHPTEANLYQYKPTDATCTGTGPRCTDTGVPKMPRMLYFAY